jgi:hypothetical protein
MRSRGRLSWIMSGIVARARSSLVPPTHRVDLRARRAILVVRWLPALAVPLLALPSVASAEVCPNQTLRSGPSALLPDCRAYEMVTPPYKEGFIVYAEGGENVSEDGLAVAGFSIGSFGGAEVDEFFLAGNHLVAGADYIFTRGSAGWEPTAVNPPARQYQNSIRLASSSDLRTALIFAVKPETDPPTIGDFLLRRPDGSFADVGSVFPPSAKASEIGPSTFVVSGSSSDLSHVFFELEGHYWPGDATTGGHSIYEYVGTGNARPLLVGVNNKGELVSTCETVFDSTSSSGETVYFTARACGSSPPVDELFARTENGLPGAHTVAISEPSSADCSECDTETGVLAGAKFVGSSADGSKVFFTTSQPLLGGDNTTNVYEYDFEGAPGRRIVRVSGGDSTVSKPTASVLGATTVSKDGSHVYFLAGGVLTTTPNGQGQQAQSGAENLYLYERDARYPAGRTAFVATLPGAPGEAKVSAGGRYLVFTSSGHLTPDDASAGAQAFEYDAQSADLARVSIGREGFDENGNTSRPTSVMVADNGEVFFDSTTPLVPGAIAEVQGIYEYRDGSVYLIAEGSDTPPSPAEEEGGLLGIDSSGANVFFETIDRLLPRDGDTQFDFYDARIGGGFPEPAPPTSCAGDACQGALGGAPTLLSPSSELQAGGENFKAERPVSTAPSNKSAGSTKKKGRKKPRRKKGKRARKANRGRSAATRGGRR